MLLLPLLPTRAPECTDLIPARDAPLCEELKAGRGTEQTVGLTPESEGKGGLQTDDQLEGISSLTAQRSRGKGRSSAGVPGQPGQTCEAHLDSDSTCL